MSDQELHKDHAELIVRYLSGQATDAEVQQLEQWVSGDPEHRRQFMAFRKAWILAGMANDAEPVDTDQQWEEMAADLFRTAKVRTLSSGRSRLFRIAAVAAIMLAISVGTWFFLTGEREVYFSAADQVQQVVLPDGSTVTLNRASSLRYLPVKENADAAAERRLLLEGDAFFDVVREPARPFRIRSGDLEVEVLGTSFYVDARAAVAEMQVIVASGSVRVNVGQSDPLTLRAGEKSVYEKAAQTLRQEVNTDINFASIRSDTLRFDDSSLEEVAFALGRHYGLSISYIGIDDPGNCELTGTYVAYSLPEIIAVLEAAWGIEIEQRDGELFFSGAGCNE